MSPPPRLATDPRSFEDPALAIELVHVFRHASTLPAECGVTYTLCRQCELKPALERPPDKHLARCKLDSERFAVRRWCFKELPRWLWTRCEPQSRVAHPRPRSRSWSAKSGCHGWCGQVLSVWPRFRRHVIAIRPLCSLCTAAWPSLVLCVAQLGTLSVEAVQVASTSPISQCTPGLADAADCVPVADLMPTRLNSQPVPPSHVLTRRGCLSWVWRSYIEMGRTRLRHTPQT